MMHAPLFFWCMISHALHLYIKQVFASFDEDGDGKIGYDEFLGVLKELGINIADAKALKCFRKIAANRSLAIDINEFRIALFALDPESGSFRGVSPNTLLTPMEAFAMFDKDSSGSIDGDELFFALQHLGIKVAIRTTSSMPLSLRTGFSSQHIVGIGSYTTAVQYMQLQTMINPPKRVLS